MKYRILSPQEIKLCHLNCFLFDTLFRFHKHFCANQECNYPLDLANANFFSHELNGKVCDLCHTLEDAARQQPGLRAAHDEWKRDQADKKKILDSGKYF